MMTEMKLPACYAVIDENEMTYLDGGATMVPPLPTATLTRHS